VGLLLRGCEVQGIGRVYLTDRLSQMSDYSIKQDPFSYVQGQESLVCREEEVNDQKITQLVSMVEGLSCH
jgi:hypothetical protein